MRKILLIAVLVVGLCLSTAVGNCALTDNDIVTVDGTTGYAELQIPKKTFHFDPHLQPGEQLAVSWWIHNNGPCLLDVDVKVTKSGTPATYLVVEFKPGYKFTLANCVWKQVALVVRLKPGCPNWKASKPFTVTVTFNSTAKATRWQSPVYSK